jgi:hypothetical protein
LQNISSGFEIVRENPRRKSCTKKTDMGTNGADRRVVCAWAGDKRSKIQLIYLAKKTYTKVCKRFSRGTRDCNCFVEPVQEPLSLLRRELLIHDEPEVVEEIRRIRTVIRRI